MAKRKKESGKCRICGKEGKLSFEHVPPEAAFNKATAIELESGLSLKRSQAKAVIDYRTKNGPFKSIDDLKKVPGIEADQIEAKKDRLSFE